MRTLLAKLGRSRWAAGPALALALSAALAGCGGSGSSSSSTAARSSTQAAATSSSASASATTSTTASATTSASATSGASPTATTSAANGGAAREHGCPTAALHLSFVSGQGAAGTAYTTYALTNIGSQTCTLYGYPGVAILDGAGRIVQHPAQRGGIQAPTSEHVVTLAKGVQARFIVTSSDVIPSPGCPHAFTGTTLQVFPPNQRQALSVPRSGQFCNLHVGPVQAAH